MARKQKVKLRYLGRLKLFNKIYKVYYVSDRHINLYIKSENSEYIKIPRKFHMVAMAELERESVQAWLEVISKLELE